MLLRTPRECLRKAIKPSCERVTDTSGANEASAFPLPLSPCVAEPEWWWFGLGHGPTTKFGRVAASRNKSQQNKLTFVAVRVQGERGENRRTRHVECAREHQAHGYGTRIDQTLATHAQCTDRPGQFKPNRHPRENPAGARRCKQHVVEVAEGEERGREERRRGVSSAGQQRARCSTPTSSSRRRARWAKFGWRRTGTRRSARRRCSRRTSRSPPVRCCCFSFGFLVALPCLAGCLQ